MTEQSPGFATFELDVDPVGRGRCVVNGQDLSDSVLQLVLLSDPNNQDARLTTLQLRLRGGAKVEGAGIVQVVLDEQQAAIPVADAVMRFLDQVDTKELEVAIANGPMSRGIGVSAIAVLKRMAQP